MVRPRSITANTRPGNSPDRFKSWASTLSILPRNFFYHQRIDNSRPNFCTDLPRPFVAIHPGSGSERKNWPLQNWIDLGIAIFLRNARLLSHGEADEAQTNCLAHAWRDGAVHSRKICRCRSSRQFWRIRSFIGHDSGISHLAAAAGARCILLFGPTDPAIWAPLNQNVRVIRARNGDLRNLDVDLVRDALDHALMRIGIST